MSAKPVKLGFGKSQPANVVWLDNLAPTVNESLLQWQFNRYGRLKNVIVDTKLFRALLCYDTIEAAQKALNETRNRTILGRKVQIDYASQECQDAFVTALGSHNIYGKNRYAYLLPFAIKLIGISVVFFSMPIYHVEELHPTWMTNEGRQLSSRPCVAYVILINSFLSSSQSGFSRRSKDFNGMGLCDSSRSGKYISSRSSHHSNSRCDSPGRVSVYSSSRTSPSKDYNNNPAVSTFRTSANGLTGSVGICSSKHPGDSASTQINSRSTSSRYDRSRASQCRKSMAPSLDYSRSFNGLSYQQHSTLGHGNADELNPLRHQSRSHRRSQHATSSASDSSSLERKQPRGEYRTHKNGSDRSKRDRNIKHKSSLRYADENALLAPSTMSTTLIPPRQDESVHRRLRESTLSTPEQSCNLVNEVNIRDRSRSVAKPENIAPQRPHALSMQPNETLTKLQHERSELLMKLSMCRGVGPGTPAPSSSEQSQPHG